MQLTDAGYQKLLNDATDATTGGNHAGLLSGLAVMFFTAAARNDRGTKLTDLTESTYTGYARAAVGAWSTPFRDAAGEWKVEAPGITSIATDAVNPNTVVGAGLVTTAVGTNAVETVAITGVPTGGTFTLSYAGQTTAPIAYNATAAAVQAALQALTNVGAGNVTSTGGPLPGTAVPVTFTGTLGQSPQPLMTGNGAGLTGGTTPGVTVTNTTPGVPGPSLYGLEMFTTPVNMEQAGNGFTYPPGLALPAGPWTGNQPIA